MRRAAIISFVTASLAAAIACAGRVGSTSDPSDVDAGDPEADGRTAPIAPADCADSGGVFDGVCTLKQYGENYVVPRYCELNPDR